MTSTLTITAAEITMRDPLGLLIAVALWVAVAIAAHLCTKRGNR